jgi:FkbH-like protein
MRPAQEPTRQTSGDAVHEPTRETIRALVAEECFEQAWRLLIPELLAGGGAANWTAARNLLGAGERVGWEPPTRRRARLALLCTYESAELSEQLRIACLALGVHVDLYVAPYGQLEQEVLGEGSGLSTFEPTHVLIAPTGDDLAFPELADDAEALLSAELERWLGLWRRIGTDRGARTIQHAFVVPDETPLGHLSLRLPSSRPSLVRELNRRLAERAGGEVLLVDCERLAGRLGKRAWLDPRRWYGTRQPVSYEALPLLARETAAVLAADLGLAARCLILDLDNTLWGGVLGEDGLEGIVVGEGPDGEAYAAFQEYVAALGRRGVVLAVASKNDRDHARRAFTERTGMRLKLEDFAMFVADWRRKPEQLAEIADALGLGLDALVFADDNPAECAEVTAALPEVTTVCLDVPASERVRLLADSVRFELSALSEEDRHRQRSYAARAGAAELAAEAASIEDFWRSLRMRARVRAVEPTSLDRAAQLIQKTNQFNLTLRRHTRGELERMMDDSRAIGRTLELEDRFASHGLIGLAIALPAEDDPDTALIDTLLLSCRVIGRTAESHLISHIGEAAIERGFECLRGVYKPGPRNALVADLYPRLGFQAAKHGRDPADSEQTSWEYDLQAGPPLRSEFIEEDS